MVTEVEMCQLKNRILEMMDFVDQVCRNNHIKYSIAYGTLIGAVRHQGFIPWDEDFDIMMDRENYERFLSIVENQLGGTAYFVENRRKDRSFTQTFTKLVDLNSEYITELNVNEKEHKGAFIDIFPLDKASKSKGKRWQLLLKGYLYKVLTRKNMFYALERALEINFETNSKKIKKDFYYFTPTTMKEVKIRYDEDLFDEYVDMKFENRIYMVTANYDSYLKAVYGNYMQLPPLEEQKSIHKLVKVIIR